MDSNITPPPIDYEKPGPSTAEEDARIARESNNPKQDKGGDLRHVIDEGLPPGIDQADLRDPGQANSGK
jgi:hypothetical protein